MGQVRGRRKQNRELIALTLILSEQEVAQLLEMKEVVLAVEKTFMDEASSRAVNSPRTRSAVAGSSLNVMHASSSVLGRAGVKCYMSSQSGTKFVFILFDSGSSEALAVMGANTLGRYRTGAASGIATKHLSQLKDFNFALYGTGWQGLTQALAQGCVAALREVRVWSPNREHREKFVRELNSRGIPATAASSVADAAKGAQVATAITTARTGFLDGAATKDMLHLNLCGSNTPEKAEALPDAVAAFETVVVDDLVQSKYESGDLIQAQRAGVFSWEAAVELKDIVSGKVRPRGKTLFKSNGVAIEDLAVASLVYDKAVKDGRFAEVSLGLDVRP